MSSKVAIFVDGDNLSSNHSSAIIGVGKSHGIVSLAKVYGNEGSLNHWANCHEFQFVYSGSGKNASDLHLAIEVTEFTLVQSLDVVLLCTSDSDFVHLARRLRERSIHVVGCGEAKTNEKFKSACSDFHVLDTCAEKVCEVVHNPKVSNLDLQIRAIISENSKQGMGMRLSDLAPTMHSKHGTRISHYPERTWRGYLAKRKSLFDLDPRGPNAMVRFISDGFYLKNVNG